MLSQGIMFFSTFILGMYYTQDAIGQFAIFSSYIAVISIFTSLRLELAISKSQNKYDVFCLLDIISITSLVFSILFFVISPILTYFFNIDIGVNLFFIYLGTIVLTIFNTSNSILVYEQDFFTLSLSKIVKAIFFIILLFALSMFNDGIIYSYLLSSLAFFIFVFKKLKFNYYLSKDRLFKSLSRIKEYDYIYKYSFPNACLNSISQQIPVISGALLYSASTIGVYFFMDKILRTPAAVILQSLRPVLIRYYSNKSSQITTYYFHVLLLSCLGLLYSIILYFIISYVMSLELMSKWQEGTIYILPILIIAFSQLSNTATVPFLLVKKKTKGLLYIEIINLISRCTVVLYCLSIHVAPKFFFELMSLVTLIMLFLNVLTVKISIKYIDNV